MNFKAGDIVTLKFGQTNGSYAMIGYYVNYYVGEVDGRGYLDLRDMSNKTISLSQDRLKFVYAPEDFKLVRSAKIETVPTIEAGQVWRNSYSGEEITIIYVNEKQIAFEDNETKELEADSKKVFLEDFYPIEKLSQWINVVRDAKGKVSLYAEYDPHPTKEIAINAFHKHSEGNYTLIDSILVEWSGKIGD